LYVLNLITAIPDNKQPRNKQQTNHLPPFYNNTEVYNLWKECITYGITFIDPVYCSTRDLYLQSIDTIKHHIQQQKQKVIKGDFFVLPINFEIFDSSTYEKQKELAVAYAHEVEMFQIRHKQCIKCKGVSLVKEYIKYRSGTSQHHCSTCKRLGMDDFWKFNTDGILPVWYDDQGIVQFHVPPELQGLRLGEQLLIQRLSCFIPIVHLKHGIMGLHGNCVCFRQDISDICNVLPRSRVNAIKIIRSYSKKDEFGLQNIDTFIIRKDTVLRALRWLKKYHRWYRDDHDVIIQESNLSWMGDNTEASLLGTDAETTNYIDENVYDCNMRAQDEIDQCGKEISVNSFHTNRQQ
jgi:hypothetical protein